MQIGVGNDGDVWCSDFANQGRDQFSIEFGQAAARRLEKLARMNGKAMAVQHDLLELKAKVVLQVNDRACLTKTAKYFCIVPRDNERQNFVAASEVFDKRSLGRKDFPN